MHLECAITDKEMIEDLCKLAKSQTLFTRHWGKKVRVRVMKDKDDAKVDLRAMASMANQHINYHASMIYDGLTGITELDRPVNVYSVTNP